MGGSGGTSGAVEFPAYIEDVHGILLAGSTVDDSNDFVSSFTTPTINLFGSIDSAVNAQPYNAADSLAPNPSTQFNFVTNPIYDNYTSSVVNYASTSVSDLIDAGVLGTAVNTSSLRELVLDFSTTNLQLPSASTGLDDLNLSLPNLGIWVDNPSLDLPSPTLSTSALSLSFPTLSLSVSTQDVDSSIAAVQELLTSMSTLDLAAPTTRYGDFISEAETTLANSTGVQSSDYASIIARADTEAQTLIGSVFSLVKANGTEVLNEVKSRFESIVDTNISDPTTVLSQATSLAEGFLSAKQSAPTSLMSQVLNLSTSFTSTNLVANTAAISNASTLAKNASTTAIAFAENLSLRGEIDNLVTAFSNRREAFRQQQLSQYNAQMAGGNAVHSSAFMFGQALIYSEQQKEVAQFDAELVKQAFDQGLQLYAQNLQTSTESFLQTYGINQEAYQRAFLTAAQTLLQTYQINTEGWTSQASQVIGSYVETYARNLLAYQQGFQTASQTFAQYITTNFEAQLTGQLSEVSARFEEIDVTEQNRLLSQAAELMFRLESENVVNADPAMAAFSQIYTGLFNARLRASINQEQLGLQSKQLQIGEKDFNLQREITESEQQRQNQQLVLEEFIAESEKSFREESLQVQSENLRIQGFTARLEKAIQEKRIALEKAAQTLQQKRIELSQETANKQAEENRFSTAYQSALKLLSKQVEVNRIASTWATERNKIKYTAKREYFQDKLEYAVSDAMWDLQVLDKSVRMLAAPSGMSAGLPEKPSKGSQVASGFLKGAGAGAAVGAAGGPASPITVPIGAGIGAVIGGIGGAI